jgi:hypothetical protein
MFVNKKRKYKVCLLEEGNRKAFFMDPLALSLLSSLAWLTRKRASGIII